MLVHDKCGTGVIAPNSDVTDGQWYKCPICDKRVSGHEVSMETK